MNFNYDIKNGQLYLAPSNDEADFYYLGFGLKKNNSLDLVSLASILPTLEEENALTLLTIEASRYPNSSRFLELQKINKDFVFQAQDEIIFYGGSFNPWHQGHRACLELLGDKKCIILPDRNPFKEVMKLSPLQIYQEIMSHLDHNHQYLNPEFILKEEKNPTYTWIKETHERLPELDLALLMGMDSLDSIESWFMAEELLKTLNRIYVASRLEDDKKQDEIKIKLLKYPNLDLVFLGHHPYETLSSTKLREQK